MKRLRWRRRPVGMSPRRGRFPSACPRSSTREASLCEGSRYTATSAGCTAECSWAKLSGAKRWESKSANTAGASGSAGCRWLGSMRCNWVIPNAASIVAAAAVGGRSFWTALVALRAPAAVQKPAEGRVALKIPFPLVQPLKLLPMWLGNSVTYVPGHSILSSLPGRGPRP